MFLARGHYFLTTHPHNGFNRARLGPLARTCADVHLKSLYRRFVRLFLSSQPSSSSAFLWTTHFQSNYSSEDFNTRAVLIASLLSPLDLVVLYLTAHETLLQTLNHYFFT